MPRITMEQPISIISRQTSPKPGWQMMGLRMTWSRAVNQLV